MISDPARYARLAASARGRVEGFFQLSDVMARYNDLYRELGGFPSVEQRVLSGELSGQRARRALEIR
ncbi:hypothetical protein A5N15_03435 [Rothia kristinae]|uniref:Uncharacterized protein n=1 Tax=Rothia kristinae TaxID=37923 RepID=A0A657IVE2_9MICC|nr:hypothetical protein A5N15_03435 [Rothia kristinae]